MLAGMFDGVLLVHFGLRAKILFVVHSLFDIILVVFDLYHKRYPALLVVSPQDPKLGIKSLNNLSTTLSGDSSAIKHRLGAWWDSSTYICCVVTTNPSRTISNLVWFVLIYYNIMNKISGKLTITVHRVALRVKFPCSLNTELKICIHASK